MPLSSRDRANYVESINQALDSIRILTPDDFGTAVRDLEKILTNASGGGTPNFDSRLKKEDMESVHDFYTMPKESIGLTSENDYTEYQQIIKDRIQAKINEFNSFNPAQKEQYITNQKAVRDQALQHQAIADAGNTDERRAANARTMEVESRAERERALQQQRAIEAQIQRERQLRDQGRGRQPAPREETGSAFQLSDEDRAFITRQHLAVLRNTNILSAERESRLSNDERARLTGGLFHHIVPGRLSVDRALQLSNEQVNLLTRGGIVDLIINGRLLVERALELSSDERAILTTGNIHIYISGGRLLPERALQMTSEQRNFLNNLNAELSDSLQIGRLSVDEVLRNLERGRAEHRTTVAPTTGAEGTPLVQGPDNDLVALNNRLTAEPRDSTARLNRARILNSMSRRDEALSDYNFLLERAPAVIAARFERAAILERRGDTALALEDYRYIFESYPANRVARDAIERLERRLPSSQQGETGLEFLARQNSNPSQLITLLTSLTEQQRAVLADAFLAAPPSVQPQTAAATTPSFFRAEQSGVDELNRRLAAYPSNRFHIIGNLYFKIEALPHPLDNGDTHWLGVITNNQQQSTIGLTPDHAHSILNNITNINGLKNIFTNIFQGESAEAILNSLVTAEREAPRGPSIASLD